MQSSNMQKVTWREESVSCWGRVERETEDVQFARARTEKPKVIQYIPLISRVRGPYGKLWTEFFPSFYGPSAKRAGHENKEGKNEDP